MKKILIIILIVVAAVGAWYAFGNKSNIDTLTLLDTVYYSCDDGKFITAAYYEDGSAVETEPSQIPVPTGRVEVSLEGAASTTLSQTISASGIRYANADESFVFWSKGNEALIMRNNAMDPAYTNCRAAE